MKSLIDGFLKLVKAVKAQTYIMFNMPQGFKSIYFVCVTKFHFFVQSISDFC